MTPEMAVKKGRFRQVAAAPDIDAYVQNNPMRFLDSEGLTAEIVAAYDTQTFYDYSSDFQMDDSSNSIQSDSSDVFGLPDQIDETLEYGISKNCFGVSDEAYQRHLANLGRRGVSLENLEAGNTVVTVIALGGLLYPPTTLVSANVLGASTLAGIGIDTAQYVENKTENNFNDLVLNIATSAVTFGAGKAITETLGLGVKYLPNTKRAVQIVKETKMYRFVPNSLVRTGTQVDNFFSSGVNTFGLTLMKSHESTIQE